MSQGRGAGPRRRLGYIAVSPPELVLATLVSVAPVLVVFLVAERYLMAGLTAGGTKE